MAPLLPLELLALQLESFDLAQSLFPLPGELELEEETAVILPSLRRWITEGHTPYGGDMEVGRDDVLPTNDIAFTVTLEVTSAANPASIHTLVLAIRLPLTKPLDFAHTLADGSPAATIRLQQPPWMSRTTHDGLAASLPSCNPSTFTSNTDLLLHTIDFLRDKVASVIPLSSEPTPTDTPTKADEPEFRVWLWFPSLSTREKRDDIVNWAPEYGLTGFVLAGASRVSFENSFRAKLKRLCRFRRQAGLALPRRDGEQRADLPGGDQGQELGRTCSLPAVLFVR